MTFEELLLKLKNGFQKIVYTDKADDGNVLISVELFYGPDTHEFVGYKFDHYYPHSEDSHYNEHYDFIVLTEEAIVVNMKYSFNIPPEKWVVIGL